MRASERRAFDRDSNGLRRWSTALVVAGLVTACQPATAPPAVGSGAGSGSGAGVMPSPGSGTGSTATPEGSAAIAVPVAPGVDSALPQAGSGGLDPAQIPGARASTEIRRRLQVWDSRGASQTELAEIFAAALDSGQRRDVEAVLVEFARKLAEYRSEWSPELIAEARSFAAAHRAPLWRRLDGRLVPAIVEALLDVEDDAAVLRLTEAFGDGPGARAFVGPRALAERRAQVLGRLEFVEVPDCPLRIDGEATGTAPVLVLPAGSHEVACADMPEGSGHTVILLPAHTTRLASDLLPP